MFGINKFFTKYFGKSQPNPPEARLHDVQLASAALMFEVIRADGTVDPEEIALFRKIISHTMEVSSDELDDIVQLSQEETDSAVSLYQFTSKITQHFNPKERVWLIEYMWRLAYADGDLDKYEEQRIRRIAELIHVSHANFVGAREAAKQASQQT